MLEGYKIIPFVPCGRKRTLEILSRYFLRNKDKLDHVQLWQNTTVQEDIDYIHQLEKSDPDLFRVYTLPEGNVFFNKEVDPSDPAYGPVQWNTGRFYKYTVDPEAIYIRFDDDIVWLQDDYFEKIVKFRVEYPDYFLVFGNIWNNAITSYISQQEGLIGEDYGVVSEPYCMDMIGWGNGPFAEQVHNILLEKIESNSLKDLFWRGSVSNDKLVWMGHGYELHDLKRFSISNFAFFGKDFAKFEGDFPDLDEELFVTEIYPAKTGKLNVICSDALVSHFTFSPYQKGYILKQTNLLGRYQELSKKKLSEGYYNLLNTHDED